MIQLKLNSHCLFVVQRRYPYSFPSLTFGKSMIASVLAEQAWNLVRHRCMIYFPAECPCCNHNLFPAQVQRSLQHKCFIWAPSGPPVTRCRRCSPFHSSDFTQISHLSGSMIPQTATSTSECSPLPSRLSLNDLNLNRLLSLVMFYVASKYLMIMILGKTAVGLMQSHAESSMLF